MHKYFNFTKLGGFPFGQNTLNYMQTAYDELFQAIGSIIGDKTILTGVVDTDGVLSDGWIVVGKAVYPFVGGDNSGYIKVQTTTTALTYADGSVATSKIYTYFTVADDSTDATYTLEDFTYIANTYKNVQKKFNNVTSFAINHTSEDYTDPAYKITVIRYQNGYAHISGYLQYTTLPDQDSDGIEIDTDNLENAQTYQNGIFCWMQQTNTSSAYEMFPCTIALQGNQMSLTFENLPDDYADNRYRIQFEGMIYFQI